MNQKSAIGKEHNTMEPSCSAFRGLISKIDRRVHAMMERIHPIKCTSLVLSKSLSIVFVTRVYS